MFNWELSSQEENCLPASSFSYLLGSLNGGNSDQKTPKPELFTSLYNFSFFLSCHGCNNETLWSIVEVNYPTLWFA